MVVHNDSTGDPRVMEIAKKFQDYVTDAQHKAYRIGTLASSSPKISRWIEVANEYLNTTRENMLPACYGYAVEELTNRRILSEHGCMIDGFTILLQRAFGHTRPDITLKDADGNVIAWMDITSEDNVYHVFHKDSKGWGKKTFVAELTYETFKKTDIVPGRDIGRVARTKPLALQRRLDLQHARIMKYFKETFVCVLRELREPHSWYMLTQKQVASAVEHCFDQKFKASYRQPIIKSMIEMHSGKFVSSRDTETFLRVKRLYRRTPHNKAEAKVYLYKAYKNKCKKNN